MNNKGASVYVVDDDVSVREAVESLVRSAGFRAETFASAQDFLAGPHVAVPSCLVLDIELPGLSGLDLQEELARADVQIPIIFLTGRGNIPMTVRAIKAGAVEFLTKPANDEDLLAAIRQSITGYGARRQPRPNLAQQEIRIAPDIEGIEGQSSALPQVLQLARLSERTRIARDLHDTLLQSFHGLLPRFQTVSDLLPEGQAKQGLNSAIDLAAQAITEGRDAVHGLRSPTVVTNDFALGVIALGKKFAADQTNRNAATVRVLVKGAPRKLHPIPQDEVYRITGEALRNAFRHSRARTIEVEILYDERQFRLRVRDDGKGIDPKVLKEDEASRHFGLHGIRERAELVGGKLDVWSKFDGGTEVELSIPASIAYATSPSGGRSWLSEKLSRTH